MATGGAEILQASLSGARPASPPAMWRPWLLVSGSAVPLLLPGLPVFFHAIFHPTP